MNAKASALLPLDDWDALIRRGRSTEVSGFITNLNLKKVPREQSAGVANLARRLGHHEVSLRLLNPVVRSELVLAIEPTPDEKAEYALALNRIGAYSEALDLLSEIDEKQFPVAFMHRAFTYISRWEYHEACKNLKMFLQAEDNETYQTLIAKVNLAASFVYLEKNDKAEKLLKELVILTRDGRHHVLLGNTLEIMAQLHLGTDELSKAQECLEGSRQALQQAGQRLDTFFVEKWKAILKASSGKGVDSLLQVRQQAQALGHWETVRDCDAHLSRIEQDEARFRYNYFGTPYAYHRKKLRAKFPHKVSIPKRYIWEVRGYNQGGGPIFDSQLGESAEATAQGSVFELKPGGVLHRLLCILITDFYRPFRLGHLFSKLYEGEYFDPVTGPDRVYRSIERLRQEFRANSYPLDVRLIQNQYQLVAPVPTGVIVSRGEPKASKNMIFVQKIKKNWSYEPFTSRQLAERLGVSVVTSNRWLREAVEQGEVNKVGQSSSTRYLLKKAS